MLEVLEFAPEVNTLQDCHPQGLSLPPCMTSRLITSHVLDGLRECNFFGWEGYSLKI